MNDYIKFKSKGIIIKIFGKETGVSIYNKYLLYNEIDKKDIFYKPTKMNNTKLKNNAIYVSFHFGPFLTIPINMLRENISFNFIASKLSNKKFSEFNDLINSENLNFNEKNFILGDTIPGMKSIIDKIKNEESFFTLIDTGVSSNDIKNDINSHVFNIFGTEIYVKSALIQLAYKHDIPIIPVFSIFENDSVITNFEDIIIPADFKNHKVIIEHIWSLFINKYLKNKPEQWETYHTLYKLIKYKKESELEINKHDLYRVCSDSYELIKENGSIYFCAYETLEIFKSSEKLNNVLQILSSENVEFNFVDINSIIKNIDIINVLIRNKIIIKSKK